MEYIRVSGLNEISAKADGRKAYYLAGGTDIMVLRKEGILEDRPVIDISALDELKGIREEKNVIDIGALVTMAELERSACVREKAPALFLSAGAMGSPLIRNLATIGGNLGNSNPAADTIPSLIALDAAVIVSSGGREKEVPADGFCTGPRCSVLEAGEVITRIRIPVLEGSSSSYIKLGPRSALSVSKVSLAAWWFIAEKKVVDIRISAGAVGPRCFRAVMTEKVIKGNRLTPDIIEKAAETIQFEVSPIDDFRSTADYRRSMAGELLRRVLKQA